jgi:hypothetical protein
MAMRIRPSFPAPSTRGWILFGVGRLRHYELQTAQANVAIDVGDLDGAGVISRSSRATANRSASFGSNDGLQPSANWAPADATETSTEMSRGRCELHDARGQNLENDGNGRLPAAPPG